MLASFFPASLRLGVTGVGYRSPRLVSRRRLRKPREVWHEPDAGVLRRLALEELQKKPAELHRA